MLRWKRSSRVIARWFLRNGLRAALAIAAKDLRAEIRSRTALVSAVALAALILVIFNLARDPTVLRPQLIAPSALWITCTFASMTALGRAFQVEVEHGAIDALLLAPVPREAIYLGKLLGNLVFVAVVEAVTLPLLVLFFNLDLRGTLPSLALVALVATVGFVAVGTVFGALAVRVRYRELLLPLLLLPFMIAPLVGAVHATSNILDGRPFSENAGWLRLLFGYDIVFVTVGLLVFPALLDE